jgi:hypothetical protein
MSSHSLASRHNSLSPFLSFIILATASGCTALGSPNRDGFLTEQGSELSAPHSPGALAKVSDHGITTSEVPIASGSDSKRKHHSVVDITWTAPAHLVDGFIIMYGFQPDALNNRVTIPLADLEAIQTGNSEVIYHYQIDKIPQNREVFVSISSYRGAATSQPTPPEAVPVLEEAEEKP